MNVTLHSVSWIFVIGFMMGVAIVSLNVFPPVCLLKNLEVHSLSSNVILCYLNPNPAFVHLGLNTQDTHTLTHADWKF